MIKKLKIAMAIGIMMLPASMKAVAQKGASIDHIALYVYDLDKSADFYKNVMQFKVIPEPFHDNKHVWFQIGPHSQLHIIKGAKEVTDHDINTHFAYTVPVLQTFIKHLEEMKVKYGNWTQDSKAPTSRPDGVKQVYLQDPDNFWIEVNDDKF
jgi:lactoylglutathione lyase